MRSILLTCCVIATLFLVSCETPMPTPPEEKKEEIAFLIRVVGYECSQVRSLSPRQTAGGIVLRSAVCSNGKEYFIRRIKSLDWVSVCYQGICRKI